MPTKDESVANAELGPAESVEDPPRNWSKVGVLATAWVTMLGLGAWAGPGIAQGGPDAEGERPITELPPGDHLVAADRYLKQGSLGNFDVVWICEGSDPEVSLDDLVAWRQKFKDDTGFSGQPEIVSKGMYQEGDRFYIDRDLNFENQISRGYELQVTVAKDGGTYCVENVVLRNSDGGPGGIPSAGPESVAIEFLNEIRRHRDAVAAAEYQCRQYSGPNPQSVIDAIDDKESRGIKAIQLKDGEPLSSEEGITRVSKIIEFGDHLSKYDVPVEIGVDEERGCVLTLVIHPGLDVGQDNEDESPTEPETDKD